MPKQSKPRKTKEKKDDKKPKPQGINLNFANPSPIQIITKTSAEIGDRTKLLPSVQQLSGLNTPIQQINNQPQINNQINVLPITTNPQRIPISSQQSIKTIQHLNQQSIIPVNPNSNAIKKIDPTTIQFSQHLIAQQPQLHQLYYIQTNSSNPQLVASNNPQTMNTQQPIKTNQNVLPTQPNTALNLQQVQPTFVRGNVGQPIRNFQQQGQQEMSRTIQPNQNIQTSQGGTQPTQSFVPTQNLQQVQGQNKTYNQPQNVYIPTNVIHQFNPNQLVHSNLPAMPNPSLQQPNPNLIINSAHNGLSQRVMPANPQLKPINPQQRLIPQNLPNSTGQLTFNLGHLNTLKPNQQPINPQPTQIKQENSQLPQMPQIQQSIKIQPTQLNVRVPQINMPTQQPKPVYILSNPSFVNPIQQTKVIGGNIQQPMHNPMPIIYKNQPIQQFKTPIVQNPPMIPPKVTTPSVKKTTQSKSGKEEDNQSKNGSIASAGRKKKKESKKVMESPQKPSLMDEHKKEVLKIYENNTQNVNGMIKEHPKYPEAFESLLQDIAKYCNINAFFKYDCFEDKIMVSSALCALCKDPRTMLVFKLNSPIDERWGFPKPYFTNGEEFNDEIVSVGMSKDHSVEQLLNLFYDFTKTLLSTNEQSIPV